MHDPTPANATPDVPIRVAPRRQIGILVFDGVEELDAVGPWEVLSHWTQTFHEDGWDAFCLSADGAPVVGAKSLVLGAHHSFDDAPPLDVLIHPGAPAPDRCSGTPTTSDGSATPGTRRH